MGRACISFTTKIPKYKIRSYTYILHASLEHVMLVTHWSWSIEVIPGKRHADPPSPHQPSEVAKKNSYD